MEAGTSTGNSGANNCVSATAILKCSAQSGPGHARSEAVALRLSAKRIPSRRFLGGLHYKSSETTCGSFCRFSIAAKTTSLLPPIQNFIGAFQDQNSQQIKWRNQW
jgi:hypothetical protein